MMNFAKFFPLVPSTGARTKRPERKAALEVPDKAVVDRRGLADAIVFAGRKRRGELEGARLPPDGSLARSIIDAGRRRRGEIKADDRVPATGSLARQIVDAGRKRRGEI